MLAATPDFTRLDGGMAPEDDYALAEPPPGTVGYGENQAFWFFDKDGKVSSYNHLDAIQDYFQLRTERHWLALNDGRVLYNYTDGWRSTPRKPSGANMEFECLEPFRRWRLDYTGTMRISSAEELLRGRPVEGPRAIVRFHIDVEMAAPPWQQGKHSAASAEAIKGDSGRFIGGERYEQLHRMKGWVKIDNEHMDIEGIGVRTHRRGTRDMARWHGHVWQTAIFPSGRGFGLDVMPSDDTRAGRATPVFNEGYVIENGRMYPAEVLECVWLDDYSRTGTKGRVRLRSELGEASIDCEVTATVWRTIHTDPAQGRYLRGFGVWGDPGDYPMNQGAARYTWGGETVLGHIERSTALTHLPAR